MSKIEVQQKKDYAFIDAIRCIAMMSIVAEHSIYGGTYIFDGFPPKHIMYIGLIQLSKFGTITFFLLAGFLLGDKFTTYTPLEYFKRRVSNTVKPWLIWSLIFLCCLLIQKYIATHKSGDFYFFKELFSNLEIIYLYTNYWFIINFLICIGTLLCFKKHLYKPWLGILLLCFTLIYSVNVYYEWFIPSHTIAIFGFVFYLWLGSYLHKHWDKISFIIKKIPYSIYFILFAITYFWSIFDIKHLIEVKSSDPYNTLRISNIFYSLAAVFLLIKINRFNFIKYLKPRETTYGIYLIHYILVIILLPEIFRPFHLPAIQDMDILQIILFVTIRFVIVYGTTLLLINLIKRTKLKWIIGR